MEVREEEHHQHVRCGGEGGHDDKMAEAEGLIPWEEDSHRFQQVVEDNRSLLVFSIQHFPGSYSLCRATEEKRDNETVYKGKVYDLERVFLPSSVFFAEHFS